MAGVSVRGWGLFAGLVRGVVEALPGGQPGRWPGVIDARGAKEMALEVMHAPVAQHGGVFLRLHPFGDDLQIEIVGQIGDGADEILIVGIFGQLVAEHAVELDEIDVEHFQVAVGGVAGAEIVDGHLAAHGAQPGDEAHGFVQLVEHHGFGDLHHQTRGDLRIAGQKADQAVEPAGIGGGDAGDVHGQIGVFVVAQGLHHQLHDIEVDEADEAQFLGDGDEMGGGDDVAGVVLHAQQGFVHDRLAAPGVHDGLEGQGETVLLERIDDLGGAAGVDGALGDAVGGGLVDDRRAHGHAHGLGQGFFGAGDGGVMLVGVQRQDGRADGEHGPDGAAGGLDDMLVGHRKEALGGDFQIFLAAVVQDEAELGFAVAGHGVSGAGDALEALAHPGDDLLGDVITVGVGDDGNVVHRSDHEGAAGVAHLRSQDGLVQGLAHAGAVHQAGEGIVAALIMELLVVLVALVDAPDDAEDLLRALAVMGEPAAGVLHPGLFVTVLAPGADHVFDAEGHALAGVHLGGAHDRVIAAGDVFTIQQAGEGAARPELFLVVDSQNLGGVGAPGQGVGGDVPVINGLPHGVDGAGDEAILAFLGEGIVVHFMKLHGYANRLGRT